MSRPMVTREEERAALEASAMACRFQLEEHRVNENKLAADLCEADLNAILDELQQNFYGGNTSNDSNGD